MEKQNNVKRSKEQKLKITVALLVALSGILAGIVELFSKCCCDNNTHDCLFVVKIVLLACDIAAVLAALVADIMGILEYGKIPTDKIDNHCFDCPYHEEIPNLQNDTLYYNDTDSKEITNAPPKKDTSAPDKRMRKQNRTFLCSLAFTALSFVLLCASVIALAII